jgi:hypothetical protein
MGHTRFKSISFSDKIEVKLFPYSEVLTELRPTLVRHSLSIGCASSILLHTLFCKLEVINYNWLLKVLWLFSWLAEFSKFYCLLLSYVC